MLKTKDPPPPNGGGWFDKIIKTQDPPPPQGGRGLLFSQRPKTLPPPGPNGNARPVTAPPPAPVRSGEEDPKPHPPFLLEPGPFQNGDPIILGNRYGAPEFSGSERCPPKDLCDLGSSFRMCEL